MTARTIRDLKTAYLVRMTDGPLVVWWEAQLLIVAADASSIAATARHRASVPVETLARFESGRRRCFVSWEVDPARFTLQRAAVFTSTSSSGSHRRCLGHHLLVAMGGGIASMEEDALEIPVFFGPYDDLVGRPACISRAVLRWLYDARTPVGPRWSHGGEDDSELQEALLGEECAGQLGGRLPLR